MCNFGSFFHNDRCLPSSWSSAHLPIDIELCVSPLIVQDALTTLFNSLTVSQKMVKTLVQQKVSIDVLSDMTEEELKDIGFGFGDAKRLQKHFRPI